MLTTVQHPEAEVMSHEDSLLRRQLRLEPEETDEDFLLDAMAITAREYVENFTQLRLITQTVRLNIDRFPVGAVRIPTGPVDSVAEIQFTGVDGVTQVLAADQYSLDLTGAFWRVKPVAGGAWPTGCSGWIDCVVGYGASEVEVPATLKQAIRLHVATQFANREAIGASATELPLGLKDMLRPWRLLL